MTDDAAYVGIPQRRFDQLDKYLRSAAGKDLDADQLMRFQRRGGRDLITARNYVGVIRFADGAQIEILPKIELSGADEKHSGERLRIADAFALTLWVWLW